MGSPLPGILSHRKLAVEWIRLLQASTLPPMKFSQHYPAKKALFNTYSHHQSGKIAMTFPRRYSTRSKLAHIGPVPYDACHTRLFSTIYAHNKTNRSTTLGQPAIHEIFESKTGTWQYLVADPSTLDAVIIDPVLDFDPATGAITTTSADMILQLISQNGYKVGMILETHIHADHITAASYLQNYLTNQQNHRPVLGIGKRIKELQELFGRRYKVLAEEYDSAFDKHFDDDETFQVGGLNAQAIHLPGHTPDHIGYRIGDNVFCGDSLFHADIGTARCDFPGGSARSLFNSGRKLLELPDHVKLWTGHDYPPDGRIAPMPYMTVQDHKRWNKHLMEGSTETVFVALRHERDARLAEPKLLHQSLQMNIRAGRPPRPSEHGLRMLYVPIILEDSK